MDPLLPACGADRQCPVSAEIRALCTTVHTAGRAWPYPSLRMVSDQICCAAQLEALPEPKYATLGGELRAVGGRRLQAIHQDCQSISTHDAALHALIARMAMALGIVLPVRGAGKDQ